MYNTVTEGLDLSDEAEATALETIESYAAAIRAGKGDAVSAAEVAKAVSFSWLLPLSVPGRQDTAVRGTPSTTIRAKVSLKTRSLLWRAIVRTS